MTFSGAASGIVAEAAFARTVALREDDGAVGTAATGTTGAAADAGFATLAALVVRLWCLGRVCVAGSALWAKAEEYIIPLMAVKAKRRTFFWRWVVRAVVGLIWRSPMDFSRY
ncbi:hypothetical protein GLI01_26970 [Gluconacetobacter liquefaciens]|nr:hypothetical protein GLI01_26970 [Gluconacetobacter liquefaciens]